MFSKTLNTFSRFKLLKKELVLIFIVVCLILVNGSISAQEKPPKPITVTVDTFQHLDFGTFIQAGSYGTVTITPGGGRTLGGTLYNKSSTFTPALFRVTALPGTLITISDIPFALLTGSNTGTLRLDINKSTDTSTGAQFVCVTGITNVYVGGILTINALTTNPAGLYSGNFYVTFIQQ